MEILTRLENKIEEVLARNKELESENERLKREFETGAAELESDNLRLKDELDRERAAKEAVVSRIDLLLKKLSGEVPVESAAPAETEMADEDELGFGFMPEEK
jgi:cell division protein ZapB